MTRSLRVSRIAFALFLLTGCGRVADAGDADSTTDGAATNDAPTPPTDAPTAGDATPATDASSDDAATCSPIWTVAGNNANASARIEDGALVLRDPGGNANGSCDANGPCYPIAVYQDGLTGDFDARVRFEQFASDAAFSQIALFVASGTEPDSIAMASMRFASTSANNLSVTLPGENTATWSNASAGTLTIQRRGSRITVNSSDGPHATQLEGSFGDAPLRIGMMVQSESGAIPTSVRVTEFTVLASGNPVQSDSFVCNSLR